MAQEKLTLEQIASIQKEYGFHEIQARIDSGLAWHLEGAFGRLAMKLLASGACMLPEVAHKDFYGNTVPSRTSLKAGTKGTLENSQTFWAMVEDGTIEIDLMESPNDTEGED